jgi:phage/plasmid-like protein (TIGR03299 family)
MVETMAYAGEKPWHKLGIQVRPDMTPNEIRIAAGLNWTLSKQTLQAISPDGLTVTDVERYYGLVRSSDGKCLDVVGGMYKPVQPEAAIEFFTKFVSAGDMTMETAGSLEGGRRIWALAKMRSGFTLAGGDEIEGYLMLMSPNIKGEAFRIMFTPIRVVCRNTMMMALRNLGGFWMSHLNEFDGDMKQKAQIALGLASEKMEEFEAKSATLAASSTTEQNILNYVYQLSGSKLLEDVATVTDAEATGSALDAILAQHDSKTVREVRETDLNKAGKLILESIVSSPGSDMVSASGTWWGAFNGVTHAVDYTLPAKTDDSRISNAWFGDRAALKVRALDLAVEYANGTAPAVLAA